MPKVRPENGRNPAKVIAGHPKAKTAAKAAEKVNKIFRRTAHGGSTENVSNPLLIADSCMSKANKAQSPISLRQAPSPPISKPTSVITNLLLPLNLNHHHWLLPGHKPLAAALLMRLVLKLQVADAADEAKDVISRNARRKQVVT